MILGVDPGISPALAFIDPKKRNTAVAFRVEDIIDGVTAAATLVDIIRRHKVIRAVVEQVGPMPGQGLGSTSRFMTAYGIIRGVLAGLDIETHLVLPTVWKHAVLPDSAFVEHADQAKRKEQQKRAAVKFVQDTYPCIKLIAPRCKVPDHNIAEAVCLAYYGLKSYP